MAGCCSLNCEGKNCKLPEHEVVGMTYLNCPYCPAQAFPQLKVFPQLLTGKLVQYCCISKHTFFAHPEETTNAR